MPHEWETFYLMVGSSSAALIGLLFVVVTLTSDEDPARAAAAARVYVTPTVFHFGAIVLISAAAVMPQLPGLTMAFVIGVPAVCGLVYVTISLYRMIRALPSVPHWTDYVFYGILPGLAYLCLFLASVAVSAGAEIGPYAVATGALALLLIGIRDAWDLATYLTYNRPR